MSKIPGFHLNSKDAAQDAVIVSNTNSISTHTSQITSINNPTKSLTTNGYSYIPGGTLLQWGITSLGAGSGSTATLTFPVAFPTACAAVVLTPNFGVSGNSDAYVTAMTASNASLQRSNSSNVDSGTSFLWFAIGY